MLKGEGADKNHCFSSWWIQKEGRFEVLRDGVMVWPQRKWLRTAPLKFPDPKRYPEIRTYQCPQNWGHYSITLLIFFFLAKLMWVFLLFPKFCHKHLEGQHTFFCLFGAASIELVVKILGTMNIIDYLQPKTTQDYRCTNPIKSVAFSFTKYWVPTLFSAMALLYFDSFQICVSRCDCTLWNLDAYIQLPIQYCLLVI